MGFVVDHDQWNKIKPDFDKNHMTYIKEALKCIQGRGIFADLVQKIYEMGNIQGDEFIPAKLSVRRALENFEYPSQKRVKEDYIRRDEWDIRSFREVGDKDVFEGLKPFEGYPFCNDAVNGIVSLVIQSDPEYFSEFRNKRELKEKCREWWIQEGGEEEDDKRDFSYNIDLEYLNASWDLQLEYEDDSKARFKISSSTSQIYLEEVSQTPLEPAQIEPLECLYIRLSGEDADLRKMEGLIKFGIYSKGLEARFESCLKNHFKLKICKIFTLGDLNSDLHDELNKEHSTCVSKRTLERKTPIVMIENIIISKLKESNINPVVNTKEYFDLNKFEEIMEIVNQILHKYQLEEVPFDDRHKLKDDLMQHFFPDSK